MARETVPSQQLNYHTNAINKNTTASSSLEKFASDFFEPEWRPEPSGLGPNIRFLGSPVKCSFFFAEHQTSYQIYLPGRVAVRSDQTSEKRSLRQPNGGAGQSTDLRA